MTGTPSSHEAGDGAARDDALVVGVGVHEEHVLALGAADAGGPIGASGRAGGHPAILAAARAGDAGRTAARAGPGVRLDAHPPPRYCARGKASLTYISPHQQ
ncbi:hypothetical protein [Clavibacter zhangzhiyongii]|uniref:hypothetical protein n=1 Tax=Clavibacter zhangzhiyongii TaxID=2768071 RepID=UPI0039DFA499